jgi:glycosyltransferase involved in cell wall biosynthesis
MDISFYCNEGDLNLTGGYGIASYNIITSLQKIGHEVNYNDSSAPIQVNFAQPPFWSDWIRPKQKSIYLFVWESTEIPDDWKEIMKESQSEIWTASNWCKKIVEDNGFKVSNVYPHGIDPIWKPLKRSIGSKLRFLHDGEPAVRKGGQLAFDSFKAAFGDQDDVELILKAKRSSSVRKYDHYGSIVGVPDGNVRIITTTMELDQVVSLYHQSHVLVSPSYGEGFGFPALQGLATGMPTIATGEWCHYKNYLGDLSIDSSYVDSPWPQVHPGKVVKPDFDDLVDKYRFVYDNYDRLAKKHHGLSFDIHEEYDWAKLTEKSFRNISERISA